MGMLTPKAFRTRFLYAPLSSNEDPLLFLTAKLLLLLEYVVEAVRFDSLAEVGERVWELVFWSPVFVLMKRSSVVDESDAAFSSVAVLLVVAAVVATVLLLLFPFVALWFGRPVIAPEVACNAFDDQRLWQPRSCLGLQWRCLGRPWALHWFSNWSFPSQQQTEHGKQSKTTSLS